MSVADTILQQLGGNRFRVMTGAKHFLSDGNALVFRLPRGFARDGINAVRITLDPSDTYTVKFFKVGTARSGYKHTTVKETSGIYAEDLQPLFKTTTGLDTHL